MDNGMPQGIAASGMDLIVTKWIALEGTVRLAGEKEEELLKEFPKDFVETAKGFSEYLSVDAEEAIAAKMRPQAVLFKQGEGGIFAALWELGELARVGMEVESKYIPIRQETVEIAECFGINPYTLHAGGSLLIAGFDGMGLLRALRDAGIPAAIIGRVTKGNDRVLYMDGIKRYLEPPRQAAPGAGGKGTASFQEG